MMVEELLKLGAKVNLKCGNNHETVLHKACENGDIVIVKKLLDYGADYRVLNKDLKTPLAYATAEIKELCFLKHETSHVLTIKDFQEIKKSVITAESIQGK